MGKGKRAWRPSVEKETKEELEESGSGAWAADILDEDDDLGDFPSVQESAVDFPDANGGPQKKKKKSKQGGFQAMGLHHQVLRGVLNKGYRVPTPIQRKAIPVILQGGDVVAMARTGSGKTAAFLVPLLQLLRSHSAKVGARALVLSPTRELAVQTMKFCADLGRYTDLRACLVVGGDSMDSQFAELARNPDIIVATPGRLLHHLLQIDMTLNLVEYVVFDEADRLFEMGFAEQLKQILSRVSANRQTVLVSATMPKLLVEFTAAGLRNPQLIRLDTETKVSEDLKLGFFLCRAEEKLAALLYMLSEVVQEGALTVVFVATKHLGEFMLELLRTYGIPCVTIYGSMDPGTRKHNLTLFRSGKVSVMVVTDLAARGIDIPLLDYVINYDFPGKPKLFVHRVGRVARAGRSGHAYSLVSPEEAPFMVDLHVFLGKKLTSEGEEAYGKFPVDVLDRFSESARKIIAASPELQALQKVVKNAYKLYHKTRPSPSPEAVSRWKDMDDPGVHPLLAHEVDDADAQRLELLSAMKNFRPSTTILEMRARNNRIPQEQCMRNRLGQGADLKAEAQNIFSIMKKKRYIHGGAIALKNEKLEKRKASAEAKDEDEEEETYKNVLEVATPVAVEEEAEEQSMSRAARRKRKRKRKRNEVDDSASVGEPAVKKKRSFKDEEFFLSYQPADKDTEQGMAVTDKNAFQRSVVDEVLDMIPDERDAIMASRQRKVWDRKRMRYVQVTGAVDPDHVAKHTRKNESGQLISAKDKKKKSIYAEWVKKNKIVVQKEGEAEQQVAKSGTTLSAWRRQQKVGRHTMGAPQQAGAVPGAPGPKEELKSAEQIAKERKTRRKNIERNQKGGRGGRGGGRGRGRR